MTTGIDCRVFVDGVRLPDGSLGDDPFAPTALSGLKVTWGRSTTLDQPDPASCTFDVMDLPGGATFVQQFKTGVPVDVYATGVETVDPDAPLVLDPGFETGAIGDVVESATINAAVTYQAAYHHGGAQSARIVPLDLSNPATAAFPPAPFDSAVDAWDQIPAPAQGSIWHLGAWVFAPLGSIVTMAPALFPDPTGAGAKIRADIGVAGGGGSWQYLELDYVADASSQWLGVAIIVDNFPTWIGTPGAWTEQGAVTRTNLVANPSTENGLSGVSAISGATPTLDATVSHSRAQSIKVVTPGAVGMEGIQIGVAAPLTTGPLYSCGVWVRSAAGVSLTLLFRFNGSSAGQGSAAIVGNGDWQLLKFDGLSSTAFDPITGAQVMIRTTAAVATTFWVDDAIVEMMPTVGGYFDGDTAPSGGHAYRWVAAPDASQSQEVEIGGSWLDRGMASVDDLLVVGPGAGTPRTISVFSGRVTDLEADFDDAIGCPVVHVTAQDFTADLENINIGDEPWNVESMEDRFERIVALSGYPVTSIIDDTVAAIPISYQDVDNQATTGLLKDLAQSVDGVLWPAVHVSTGAYLRVEDPSTRSALFTLAMIDGVVVIVPRGSAAATLDISACDVLRDPVHWQQSVADVSTRVAVSWLEQTLTDDGLPDTAEHTETLIDAELEVDHGVRRISVSTQLTSASDAISIGTRILARTGATGWRVSGFQIVDDASIEVVTDETVRMMMRLLDGTARIGLPIRLIDLPVWAPTAPTVGVYLEGGDYEYIDGTWSLSLTVSSAVAVGESLPWADVPSAWRWVDFDPSISWLDMVGVAAPSEG
jgi:hypothetical protein